MITDIEATIREYLPQVIHLSLATSANNKPWVCEVHFVFDQELNLYFRSRSSTRHSKEIALNSSVAGNIVKQHSIENKPRGVYFEGICELLTNVQSDDPAFTLYKERFNTDQSILEEAQTENGHKFFKISVTDFYVFDAIESSPSQKYHLPWKT